jgi:prepilin-type N-terminal cleavage/methylation domain-containing protein
MALLGNNKRGYTLIELLMVVALISLFLAIAVPRFSFVHAMREKQEIKYLYKDLLYARNKAVVEKKSISFDIDLAKNSYRISEGTKEIKKVELKNGVILEGCTNGNLLFNRIGSSGDNAQTITFRTRSGDWYQITIPVATPDIKLKKVD